MFGIFNEYIALYLESSILIQLTVNACAYENSHASCHAMWQISLSELNEAGKNINCTCFLNNSLTETIAQNTFYNVFHHVGQW